MKQSTKQRMRNEIGYLRKEGMRVSQISRKLGIDRKTVRKYLKMPEGEFDEWLSNRSTRKHKLIEQKEFIKGLLEDYPGYSASQIEDRLKEKGPLCVHSKTVYNEVQRIRKQYSIPKPKDKSNRLFEKVPETEYGQQSQVDFGEHWMVKEGGGRHKVYFISLVLSRSRYKQVWFEKDPFITQVAIQSLQKIFEWQEGVTQEIWFDQDKLFLKDENSGDLIQTKLFKRYQEAVGFQARYCRKSDPQTKGKIENVIKYIKGNFLKGRKYKDIGQLNDQAQAWLQRTGNGTKHQTTYKIPAEEWQIEKQYLSPISKQFNMDENQSMYTVRKDHTVRYKRNFYTVPLGTYTKEKGNVTIKEIDGKVHIYSKEKNEEIAVHTVSHSEGKIIRNNNHARDYSQSHKEKETSIVDACTNKTAIKDLLTQLHLDKPRYYNDQLRMLLRCIDSVPIKYLEQAVTHCLQIQNYSAKVVWDFAIHYQSEEIIKKYQPPNHPEPKATLHEAALVQPHKRDISNYHRYFLINQK